jgi:3-oxoacyl-[acyl-carrier protein] reductase
MEAGARVNVADMTPIEWAAGKAGLVLHKADLGRRQGAHDLVAAVLKAAGRVDILVNAAGGVRGQVGRPIEEIGEADWKVLFASNVDSAFWLAQALAPSMQKAGYGRLVMIASGAGLRPSLTGIQAYTSAKHALVGLTKQLSQDLARFGITCNAVAPGFVRSNPATERQWAALGEDGQRRLVEGIHTRRTGQPEDIANAVVFLASRQAAWITGQILSVDGGRS